MLRRNVILTVVTFSIFLVTSNLFAGGIKTAPPCTQPSCVNKCVNLQPVPWYKIVAMYPANRILDAMDVVRVSVSTGPGAGINVRTTNLGVTAGAGNYSATCFGMRGRIMPAFEESVQESGFAVAGNVCGNLQSDPTEIGATAHALVGLNVAASTSEALDFLAGIVCIDLQGDDLTPSPWD